jgi:hypothetical protein
LRAAIHARPVNEPATRIQASRLAEVEADLAVKRAHLAERIGQIFTRGQTTKLKEIASEVDSRVDAITERICTRIAEQ